MTDHAFAFKSHARRYRASPADRPPNGIRRSRHGSQSPPMASQLHHRGCRGFSGVEVAGEINELVRSSTRFLPKFSTRKMWLSAWFIPRTDPARSSTQAPRIRPQKDGKSRTITMLLNTRAVAATHEGVELNDGRMLTAPQSSAPSALRSLPLCKPSMFPKERGRIRTTPEMRIEGQTNAWAIGDCAYIINAFDNKPAAPTGQFAERQGRQAALNVVRILKAEPTQPFRFKALGQLWLPSAAIRLSRKCSACTFPASSRGYSGAAFTSSNFPRGLAGSRSALTGRGTSSSPAISAS